MKYQKYLFLAYWKIFYARLETKDKRIAITGASLVLVSFIVLIAISFFIGTLHPTRGGEFKEGLVGTNILKLNPVLASNENEEALINLLYRGLFNIDANGAIIPDLAQSYEIQNKGAVWIVTLKDKIVWQDGTPITSDDVLYTVNLIHDLENKTPLQYSWQGVNVEKITDRKVKFSIPNPYAFFLTNLKLKIIPKHIFESTPTENILLSPYNVKPIGSGAYKVRSVTTGRDGSLERYTLERVLTKEKVPYIEDITFLFYETKTDAIRALNFHQIDALANVEPEQTQSLSSSYNVLGIKRPLYYAAFLNPQNVPALKDARVREALALSTPQRHLIEKVLLGHGTPLDSPIPPPIKEGQEIKNDIEKAKSLLTEAGWSDKNEEGIRRKDKDHSQKLSFTIVTPQNSFLIETASILAKRWAELGISAKVEIVPLKDLEINYIEPRKYDILLFGNVLDLQADPFSFWHSSQKFNPGRNLSLYQNKEVDKITEAIRETVDSRQRTNLYTRFENIIKSDYPVIFLYNPDYLYVISKRIKNVTTKVITTPSERFSTINDWFITSSRSL
ncbi:MAG: peptide ABC transporter substrate-binding protein [Parcubacteria group bacterium]|nr:peptide ABC transporter substrate-binding protein [Parcubacteria group bacterium]